MTGNGIPPFLNERKSRITSKRPPLRRKRVQTANTKSRSPQGLLRHIIVLHGRKMRPNWTGGEDFPLDFLSRGNQRLSLFSSVLPLRGDCRPWVAESVDDVTFVLRCFHRLEMEFRHSLTNENCNVLVSATTRCSTTR
jgi:hypothetical protein